MALLFFEGFDDSLAQQKNWAPYSSSFPSFVTGRYGGKAIQSAYYQISAKRGYPAATGTVYAGMALQPSSTGSTYPLVTHGMARLTLMAGVHWRYIEAIPMHRSLYHQMSSGVARMYGAI